MVLGQCSIYTPKNGVGPLSHIAKTKNNFKPDINLNLRTKVIKILCQSKLWCETLTQNTNK